MPVKSKDYQSEKQPEVKLGKQEDGSELVKIQPSITCSKGNHIFMYKSSREVICIKCPVGYPIDGLTEIIDGHLYRENILLI